MGGRVCKPELGSVIVGGCAEAKMAMQSREGLFDRRGPLAPLWLLGGLNVFLSLSDSALTVEPAPAADALWAGKTSSPLSVRGRLGLEVRTDIVREQRDGDARFRFSDWSLTGVNGGDGARVSLKLSSSLNQRSTRDCCAAAIEGDSGGVEAMAGGDVKLVFSL